MENKGSENSTGDDAREEQQPRQEKWKWKDASAAEEAAALAFTRALVADAFQYMEMTEEEVVEEYRQKGKLHKYDPEKEWQKRFARVVRAHPPPPSLMAFMPEVKQYLKYLDEEDEQDHK